MSNTRTPFLVSALVVATTFVACDKSPSAKAFSNSKVSTAWITTQKLANESFGEWAQMHPSKMCPGSIDELTSNTNQEDRNDPWGHPYVMLCGSTLPAGAKGIAILSLGADGKQGTADDIKSWEKQPADAP